MNNDLVTKLARILDIQAELDARKALYEELDNLVLELRAAGFTSTDLNGMRMELVDNFAEGKNTVFRPAGVKRFEMDIEPTEKALKREAKAAKKAGA